MSINALILSNNYVHHRSLMFLTCSTHTLLNTHYYIIIHYNSYSVNGYGYFVDTLVFLSHEKFSPYDLRLIIGLLGSVT